MTITNFLKKRGVDVSRVFTVDDMITIAEKTHATENESIKLLFKERKCQLDRCIQA